MCNNVFHKSCLHRFKNQITFVKENKIICCNDLKDTSYKSGGEESILEKTIHELTDDAVFKTQYINKLKSEHEIFVRDALMAEEEMNELIKNKDELIKQLNKKLEILSKKYMRDNETTKTIATQTENQVINLSVANSNKYTRGVEDKYSTSGKYGTNNLTSKIKTHSGNCELTEISNTKTGVSYVEPKTNVKTNLTQNKKTNTDIQTVSPSNKRVLILSDDIGRNVNKILSNNLKNENYYIESILKPGATFQQVVENIDTATRSYTSQDNIIILAGSNNFNKVKRYPLFKDIWDTVKKCSHLNITVATVPYSNNYRLNKFINKFNNKLIAFISKIDNYVPGKISLLNLGNSFSFNLKKNVICHEILKIIRYKNNIKNLTFINVKCSLDSEDNSDCINVYNVEDSFTDVGYTNNNNGNLNDLNTCAHPSPESINAGDLLMPTSIINAIGNEKNLSIQSNNRHNSCSDNFLYPRLSQLILM